MCTHCAWHSQITFMRGKKHTRGKETEKKTHACNKQFWLRKTPVYSLESIHV